MGTFEDAFNDLNDAAARSWLAGRDAANAMAELYTEYVQRELTSRRHPSQTKTPSPRGSPPAAIRGDLADSMEIDWATSMGADSWIARTGPTAAYSRVQELGGWMESHPMMHWWEDGNEYFSKRHYLPE